MVFLVPKHIFPPVSHVYVMLEKVEGKYIFSFLSMMNEHAKKLDYNLLSLFFVVLIGDSHEIFITVKVILLSNCCNKMFSQLNLHKGSITNTTVYYK